MSEAPYCRDGYDNAANADKERNVLRSEIATLKARIDKADAVIHAFRIYSTDLLSFELDVVLEKLEAYDAMKK